MNFFLIQLSAWHGVINVLSFTHRYESSTDS